MCPTALRRSLRCLLGRWVFDAHGSSSPQCNKAPLWPLSRTKMLELKRFVFHFLTRTPDLGFGISGGVTASGMGLQTLRSFVLRTLFLPLLFPACGSHRTEAGEELGFLPLSKNTLMQLGEAMHPSVFANPAVGGSTGWLGADLALHGLLRGRLFCNCFMIGA